MVDRDLISKVKNSLNKIARSQSRLSVIEEVVAELCELSGDEVLRLLPRAIDRSKKRREASVSLLAAWIDALEVRRRFAEWLEDPDPEWRFSVASLIGMLKLRQLGPEITRMIVADADRNCRSMAIKVAGDCELPEALPVLLELAATKLDETAGLLWALKDYSTPECEPFLRECYTSQFASSHSRVVAAWGLAKLGDHDAMHFLVDMLDDPPVRTPTSFEPGEGVRAAQAICDVRGWPFEWGRDAVDETKRLIADQGGVAEGARLPRASERT